jgi:hypothetical protein
MKSLILGSVLAMVVVACIEPTTGPQTEPQAQPQEPGIAQTFVDGLWSYCVTAGPQQCIIVPVHDGATQECLSRCRAAGFPSPHCIYVNDDTFPCEFDIAALVKP